MATRVLKYYRAILPLGDANQTVNLEQILQSLLGLVQLPCDIDDGDHCLKLTPAPQDLQFRGVSLDVEKYARNSHAIVIEHDNAHIDTQPPPDGKDFVRGRYFALIREHHVVVLHLDKLRHGTCKRVGQLLVADHPGNPLTPDEKTKLKGLKLLPPMQRNALQQIRDEGVKEIRTTQLVPAGFVYEQRRRGTANSFQIVAAWLGLNREDRLRFLDDPNGRLRFLNSTKPATRRGDIREHELAEETALAERAYEEGDDDLTIILKNGTKLTREQMEYRKAVQFEEPHPGHISAQDAFNALLTYYNELRNGGAFD